MSRLSESSVGSNLSQIPEISIVDPWAESNMAVKCLLNNCMRVRASAIDQWRIEYLPKLLNAKMEAFYSSNNSKEAMIDGLISSLVTICING